jgi:hypothetical protein
MRRQSLFFVALLGIAIASTGCDVWQERERASYLPLTEVEDTYGQLITAGNHPTPDQNGTGERVGLFRDAAGTVWGLPLTATSTGAVLACAPPSLHDEKITDTFPAGSTILGSTNQPTGWRGGTGNLELLLRREDGTIKWQAVRGAQLNNGPVCWAAESPGPPQQLHYYRIAPAASGAQ